MRGHSSAINNGLIPEPPSRLVEVQVRWDVSGTSAVVQVTNEGSTTAVVTAIAQRYRPWLNLPLPPPGPPAPEPPLRRLSLVAVEPGATEAVVVPVRRPGKRTQVDVKALAAGRRPEQSSWLLAAVSA